jgi:hypothetical protein
VKPVSPPHFIICFSVHSKLPFAADDKATGDPYCTVFVGHLSRHTDEETVRKVMSYLAGTVLVLACWMWDVPLAHVWGMVASCWMQAMNRYGRVKSIRLVRDIGEQLLLHGEIVLHFPCFSFGAASRDMAS